jgi:hypothetical protein
MSGEGEITTTRTTLVDRPVREGRLERWRGHGERWLGLVALAVAAVVKIDAYRGVVHHRAGIMALLGVALLFSVLRPRPVVFALVAAPFVALALHPHPLLAGLGAGFGAFVLLMTLFFGIATVLHARQHRR